MGSYIEEFQNPDREKESNLVITIDGPSGSGKGTLARYISDLLDIEFYSAGNIFRNIASERGLTVNELSEQADKDTDLEVDRRILENALENSCVVDSRISSRVLGDYSDFKIYLTADLEERAKRIADREDIESIEEAKKQVRKRDRDNDQRYKRYYNLDMEERSIYDLIMDNTDLGVEEQNQLVGKALRKRFPERFE